MADRQGPDRNLALELVRVTEAAALAAARWVGRGDKEGADGAAVSAMRVILQTVPMDGVVVIGEGEKDEAPMLYNGEKVGDGTLPAADIAVDPIEGTTLCSLGQGGATSVIAVADRGTMFDPGPLVYMERPPAGRKARGLTDTNPRAAPTPGGVGRGKGKPPRAAPPIVLARPRHEALIAEIRAAGARIRLIEHG